LGLLFLIFLILKLTHVIDWSWWWVTSPLWLPVVLGLGGLLVLALLGITGYKVVTSMTRKRSGQAGGAQAEPVVEARGVEVTMQPTPGPPAALAAPAAPAVPAAAPDLSASDPRAPGPEAPSS
jgi:hypothetical protein